MPGPKRALLPDFCEHLHVFGAWPTEPQFEASARLLAGGYAGGTLTELRRGNPVPAQYCRVLTKIRLEPGQERLQEAFEQFLASRGVDVASATDMEILDGVCRPIGDDEDDWVIAGEKSYGRLFTMQRMLSRVCRPCKDAREVMDAVRWQYIDCGRFRRRDPGLPAKDAIAVTEMMGQFGLAEHQHRIVQWWKREPRTMMLIMGSKRPIGMSRVFPLTEEVWNEVRAGNRSFHSVFPHEMLMPSNFIIHDMFAQRSVDEGGEAKAYTMAGMITILRQYGTFANVKFPAESDFNCLSIATNDIARERLKGNGYKPVGTKMHLSDVDIYERRIAVDRLKVLSLDSLFLAVAALFSDGGGA